jgi:hypothetical protein
MKPQTAPLPTRSAWSALEPSRCPACAVMTASPFALWRERSPCPHSAGPRPLARPGLSVVIVGMDSCTYCGEWGDTRDHVTPVAWNRVRRQNGPAPQKNTVPCCSECNSFLGARPLFTIEDRASYLAEALSKYHRKILALPNWSVDELAELGATVRRSVLAGLEQRKIVARRLARLRAVARGGVS